MEFMRIATVRPVLAFLVLLAACAEEPGGARRAGPGNVMGATLSGQSEVPPTSTSGRGMASVSFDRDTQQVSWEMNWGGLSGPVTAGDFHGPAVPGQTAPVVLPLAPPGTPLTSPLHGTARIDGEQAADLLAGKWYVNLHTTSNPNGEIRGQVMPK